MENHQQPLILIVDDNPNNIQVIFTFLKQSGFKVLVATNGEDALRKLERVTPDLILLVQRGRNNPPVQVGCG